MSFHFFIEEKKSKYLSTPKQALHDLTLTHRFNIQFLLLFSLSASSSHNNFHFIPKNCQTILISGGLLTFLPVIFFFYHESGLTSSNKSFPTILAEVTAPIPPLNLIIATFYFLHIYYVKSDSSFNFLHSDYWPFSALHSI